MKSYPTKFKSFLWKIVQMGTLQKLQNSMQTQEPITRSVQFPYFRATAFSQVELFLDMPFPPKITVSCYVRIEIWVKTMVAKLRCFCYCIPFSTCRFPLFQISFLN